MLSVDPELSQICDHIPNAVQSKVDHLYLLTEQDMDITQTDNQQQFN